jgi:hypothetical protein
MKRLIVGPCCCCSKKIWDERQTVGADKKPRIALVLNDTGTHFWVKSNYGSRMKIAICKECAGKLTMPKVAEIVDNVVYTWILDLIENENISEEKRRYEFNKIRFYVADNYALKEEDLQ